MAPHGPTWPTWISIGKGWDLESMPSVHGPRLVGSTTCICWTFGEKSSKLKWKEKKKWNGQDRNTNIPILQCTRPSLIPVLSDDYSIELIDPLNCPNWHFCCFTPSFSTPPFYVTVFDQKMAAAIRFPPTQPTWTDPSTKAKAHRSISARSHPSGIDIVPLPG